MAKVQSTCLSNSMGVGVWVATTVCVMHTVARGAERVCVNHLNNSTLAFECEGAPASKHPPMDGKFLWIGAVDALYASLWSVS
jgi:hypothetical protein